MNTSPHTFTMMAAAAAAGVVLLVAVAGAAASSGGSPAAEKPAEPAETTTVTTTGTGGNRQDMSINLFDRLPQGVVALADPEAMEKQLLGKTFTSINDPAVTISFTRPKDTGSGGPFKVEATNGCNIYSSPATITPAGQVELTGVSGTRVNCVLTQEQQVQEFLSGGSFSLWMGRENVYLAGNKMVLGFRENGR